MGIFGKLFGNRQLKKLNAIADKVDALSEQFAALSDAELTAKTDEFKERYNNGEGETLEQLLPEAFAAIREAAQRVLGMRPYYVQILGAIVLHQGRIAEMKTGEGKTLVAPIAAYLNALKGEGVHIVTVNDYLAKFHSEWMGKLFKFMGMKVSVVLNGMSAQEKRDAYNADVTYATNNELGFDYLRDNMAVRAEDKMQRKLCFAIIDEVDSILIDEARTPLIISGAGEKSSEMYLTANRFAKSLLPGEYIIEAKEKTVRLDEDGVTRAERFFKLDNLTDIENQDLVHYINNAMKARFIMKLEKDYIVQDGEVIIVDEFTGRLMVGRRYNDGLHQAIEAKENVRIQGEDKTLATITFQNYFRLYKKLSGMTGTAKTEEAEFADIYRLDVVEIPPNKPSQRIDEKDVLYPKEKGKFNAILEDIKNSHAKGQPVLVGTVSVEKSEALSQVLTKNKIPHHVLNAKNHKNEAEIVAQAGRYGTVTIATNMAGRGTDIILGGNAEFLALNKLENLGYPDSVIAEANGFSVTDDGEILKARDEYRKYYELFKKDTDAEKEKVIEAGGLRIIGSEKHESRRIDNQLRGRAGRQGDPGSSVFYLSFDDDVINRFGVEDLNKYPVIRSLPEDRPIQLRLITNIAERSQRRVEDRNFSSRKHTLQYDDVMNAQRDKIYAERNKVLDGLDVHEQIKKMCESVAAEILTAYVDYTKDYEDWDYEGMNRALEDNILEDGTDLMNTDVFRENDLDGAVQIVMDKALAQYDKKIEEAKQCDPPIDYFEVERVTMLRIVDRKWIEHLDNMQRLKEGVGLQAYGQRDPVVVYRRDGADMFNSMVDEIHREVVRVLMKSKVTRQVERKVRVAEKATNAEPVTKTVVRSGIKVGRNDQCPCGSGDKYKHCCSK